MKILSREYKTDMGRLNWCNLPGENADPSQALKNRYILRFTWQQLTNPLVHHPPPPPPGPREAICWLKKKGLSAGLSA